MPKPIIPVVRSVSTHRLLRPKEAAHYLGLAPSTLAKMRGRGNGPAYVNYSRAIAYRLEDLDFYAAQHIRQRVAS